MSSHRLHVDTPIAAGRSITLAEDQARYVGRVLRLRPGDEVTLFDGSGAEYRAVIESIGKHSTSLNVTEASAVSLESPLAVHLLQGISRGDRMDHVVQKATELGVVRVTPVLTEYSVVRLSGQRAAKRRQHWQGIAASACEQCGRNVLPAIDLPVSLRDTLGTFVDRPGTRVVLSPGAAAKLSTVEPEGGRLALLVGPEGGFSAEEIDLAAAAGFLAVGFGPRILRTETAAVAALAALQGLFGDLA